MEEKDRYFLCGECVKGIVFKVTLKTNVFQRGVHSMESEMLLYGGGRKSDKRFVKQRFWVTSSARSCPSKRQRM